MVSALRCYNIHSNIHTTTTIRSTRSTTSWDRLNMECARDCSLCQPPACPALDGTPPSHGSMLHCRHHSLVINDRCYRAKISISDCNPPWSFILHHLCRRKKKKRQGSIWPSSDVTSFILLFRSSSHPCPKKTVKITVEGDMLG